MTDRATRTADGARDSVALLDALLHNDPTAAQVILDHCDPEPTIFCLASAWVALVEMKGLDGAELIASMRKSIEETNR